MSLLEELKRRNVFRVGAAYAVAAWVLLQVLDVVGEILEPPDWGGKLILALLVVGFVIALLLAWAYELTPEGVKRESEIDRREFVVRRTGRKLNVLIIGLMAVAIAYLLFDKFYLSPRLDRACSETARADLTAPPPPAPPAGERGVANVMEGSVQRAGDTVRINVQLIDAGTDQHLWARVYDRDLTAYNLFAIQSEISEEIACSLQATLSPEEQQRLDERPTENLAAYNAYLRGRQLMARRNSQDVDQAALEFRRAVELDPAFALAWVGIAESAALQTQYSDLAQPESIERQHSATERALALDDKLGEAYLGRASLVHGLVRGDTAGL